VNFDLLHCNSKPVWMPCSKFFHVDRRPVCNMLIWR